MTWKITRINASTAITLAILLAATASGCGEQKPETVAAAPVAPSTAASSPRTSASSAPSASKDDFLNVTAPLIVEHQVDVTAQREGLIASISAEAGARVAAGTVLARLDDRQLGANLEAARAKTRGIEADLKNWQAEAEVLRADYARAQRLWDEKLIAEEQLQHAKYKMESDQWDILRVKEQLNTAREEEHALELELEKTRITAPFSGLVARRYVREGQSVAKGDRTFWVTAEAPLLVRFTLPEKFLGHASKGQTLTLTSLDVPGEEHSAKITQISPVIDPSSATIEVVAQLTGASGGFRPGMTVTIRVPNPR